MVRSAMSYSEAPAARNTSKKESVRSTMSYVRRMAGSREGRVIRRGRGASSIIHCQLYGPAYVLPDLGGRDERVIGTDYQKLRDS